MKEQEDHYRRLFVSQRGSVDVQSRTVMLDDVFEKRDLFQYEQNDYDVRMQLESDE